MRANRLQLAAVAALTVCLAPARTAVALMPPPQSAGQAAPPAGTAVQDPPSRPADLDRIRTAVSRDPAFKFDESQIRFYLQVMAPTPTFADFVKGQDLTSGPVADAPITHQDFLDMVTPKELYSAAGIRPTEALQFAITGLVGQMLVKRAFDSITDSWRARQIRELNQRIDSELAALRGRDK
jgi:hypothetical protein